jgi:hypothetical protein
MPGGVAGDVEDTPPRPYADSSTDRDMTAQVRLPNEVAKRGGQVRWHEPRYRATAAMRRDDA